MLTKKELTNQKCTWYMKTSLGRLLIILSLASSWFGLTQAPVWAATYLVTNTADAGPGSLRAAIIEANSQVSSSFVDLRQLNGTIILSSSFPTITGNVSLVGPGANRLTIQAAVNANYRLLINTGFLSLSGLTLSNGQAEFGGAIYNKGSLSVTDCFFTHNLAQGGRGEDDLHYGAEGGGGGGGGGGFGGAIFQESGTLNINNSAFSTNLAQGGNGGNGSGHLGLNRASSGEGGGGAGLGGAIFVKQGNVNINNSTFNQNQARGGDGGENQDSTGGPGYDGGRGGGSNGGAGGHASAAGSTRGQDGGFGGGGGGGVGSVFYPRGGTGGFGGGGGGADLDDPAMYPGGFAAGSGGNWDRVGGGGGSGLGSGVFVYDGAVNIYGTTLARNQNAPGNLSLINYYGAGALGNNGGTIYVYGTATLNLKNSLDATNTNVIISSTSGPDVIGSVQSGGYNLIQNPAGALITGTTTGNLIGLEPLLGTLQNYGGSTPTLALLSGSPAINAGDPSGCRDSQGALLANDQRGMGYSRKVNRRCDIGAYEYQYLEVNTSADTTDNSCDPLNFGLGNKDCTLREALLAANLDQAGTIIFNRPNMIVDVSNPLPEVTAPITIHGNCLVNGPTITINGNSLDSPGLVIKGGVNLVGLRVSGFKRSQIVATSFNKTANKLYCVQTSALSESGNVHKKEKFFLTPD